MTVASFDTESNGLLDVATMVHCVCIVDDKGESFEFTDVPKALAKLDEYETVVAVNGNGFDFPLLEKLYGWTHKDTIDVQLWSRLIEPDRAGGHAVEQYAKEFGKEKVGKDITDWSKLTPLMLERCMVDAEVGIGMYKLLKPRITPMWDEAVKLETEVGRVHAKQVCNGVLLDLPAAHKLADELDGLLATVRAEILEGIPPKAKQLLTTITKPFLKSGEYAASVTGYYGTDAEIVWGAFTRIVFEGLNLDSPIQVKTYLLTQGWVPIEHTAPSPLYPQGSPKLTEESYPSIKGELGKLIAEKNILTHRRNMVRNTNKKGEDKGFVHHVRADGRITADAITCGTPTARYAHRVVANLPRPTTRYGKEIRSLFIVPEGRLMLGWDLCGIENRIAGHYLHPTDGGVFAKEVLEGDFHQTTADSLGITRDEAKTFRYMILYGARPPRIAATMGWPLKKARAAHKAFWGKEYKLKKLLDKLISAVEQTGSIKGLDGRRIIARSKHKLLNDLFQSAAAIVFKRALVILDKKLEGVDYKRLITYHDEAEEEVWPQDVEFITKQIKAACKEAGEYYNLNVPIDADVHVGKNWAEVH